MPLSAVDCVQPAIQHTRDQLFTRFRWGQWCRLALVGILAAEMHVGSCGGGRHFSVAASHQRGGWLPPAIPHIDPARLVQFAGLIALIILLAVVLFFVFLYISSVFRFILFDSVLRRQCSISEGWQRWQRAGGRFFLWQLVFQISVGLFGLIIVGVPLALAVAAGWLKDPNHHIGGMIGGAVLWVGLILIFVLTAVVAQVLAKDFLVPIMALEGLDFADGWSRLLTLIGREPGKYFVYLLLKLVLSIAAAILFGILAIIPALVVIVPAVVAIVVGKTAGLAWNPATISLAVIFGTVLVGILIYLIALVCVPATVFFPAYSIYFLAARYPNLAALLYPAPAASPVPGAPPPEAPPLPSAPEPIG